MRTYPEAFLKECAEILGAEYPAFLSAMNESPRRALRLNPLRENAEGLALPYLAKENNHVKWEPLGRYVSADEKPGSGLAHFGGAFYLQDASAMAPVAALDPKPGERVLDLCAAPGGKSGQIASRMAGEGFLLSNEIEFSRARILMGNLERLGVANAFVTSSPSDVLSRALPEFFDAALVDAPCSGEGMFRRDPDAVTEWTPASPEGCASRQREILENAARLVKPGGRLVYSTCTFNRTENENVISAFLDAHREFSPADFSLDGIGSAKNGCLRLWPHRIEGEGHFVAKLLKNGDAKDGKAAQTKKTPPTKNARDLSGDAVKLLLKDALSRLPDGIPSLDGDSLRLLPLMAPALSSLGGVRVVRAGLPLARIGRGYAEPEHALAMASAPSDALRSLTLSDDDAERYLAGETLEAEAPAGWTLAIWRGLPLGWGKVSGGQMKNHLPKGLRRR